MHRAVWLWKGFVRIRIAKGDPERFLNLCSFHQMELKKIRQEDSVLSACVLAADFKRMLPFVRKANVRLSILEKRGLPFFLRRNRKRAPYIVGVAAFFLLIFIMSRFLWNITLEGNYRVTDDMMIGKLHELEVCYGMAKSAVNCSRLEEELRDCFPELTWVSASLSGTRLTIRVREKELSDYETEVLSPRDLVAEMDGVITDLVVRRGKAQVSIGDTVSRGQVLVSGEIPIYDDNQTLVRIWQVAADASIRAKVSIPIQERFLDLTQERVYTRQTRYGLLLRVGRFRFLWSFPIPKDTAWEIRRQTRQLVLFEDFYLPIWYETIQMNAYETYERNLSEEEAQTALEVLLKMKLSDLQKKGVQIIENNVRIRKKGTWWETEGDLIVELSMGTGMNIKQKEEQTAGQ